ncbi:unnamed protein product [Malus baccata var. baccata]
MRVSTSSVAVAEALAVLHGCEIHILYSRLGYDGQLGSFPNFSAISANMAADRLALRQSREVCDNIWVNRPPSSLVHVLCNDGLPCPH